MSCACWAGCGGTGSLELMLELPDGSKRLIPAEQTSQHGGPEKEAAGEPGTLGADDGPAEPVRAGFRSFRT